MPQKTALLDHHSRTPLSNSTNDLYPQLDSQTVDTDRTTKPKKIRRTISRRALHAYVDSSESLPSEHSSIFEAVFINPSAENVNKEVPWRATYSTGGRSFSPYGDGPTIPTTQPQRTATPANPPTRTIYRPTSLETIIEQNSIATLRAKRKSSFLSQLSKPPSTQTLKATVQARHKLSFSLDDLTLLKNPIRTKSLLKTSSSESSIRTFPLDYPYPNHPAEPPPPRMPTPPGLPTFNTPAAADYVLPAPPFRFRNLFRITSAPADREYNAQTAGLPRGVVMRGENGVLIRGRWRPGQSGHTGTFGRPREQALISNPFHRAPVASVVEGRRTATGSAGLGTSGRETVPNRNSGTGTSQSWNETRNQHRNPSCLPVLAGGQQHQGNNVNISTTARSQQQQEQRPPLSSLSRQVSTGMVGGPEEERSRHGGKWNRFGELLCLVCCGADRTDEGGGYGYGYGYAARPRVVVGPVGGGVPVPVPGMIGVEEEGYARARMRMRMSDGFAGGVGV